MFNVMLKSYIWSKDITHVSFHIPDIYNLFQEKIEQNTYVKQFEYLHFLNIYTV